MLNQLLRSGNQRSKSWPSQEEFLKELGFGQCDGPRGGTSKPAPEQAPPSDAEAQVTARIMQSFVPCTGMCYMYHMDSNCSLLNENKPRITNRMGQLLLWGDEDST